MIMRSVLTFYPMIRRAFKNISELGELINRSDSYCKKRLAGHEEFTDKEKRIIANYLGILETEVTK